MTLRALLAAFAATCFLAGAARAEAPLAAAACPPVARPPTAAEQAVGQREARDRGFLWQATKDGRTSWLYGTIHLGRMAWTFPGPTVLAAMKRSDLLALELDPTDPQVSAGLQDGMKPDPDVRLPDGLNERLQKQMRAACLPEALAQQMAPEMLGMALTVMAVRREGLDPLFGIDLSLARLAPTLGKPIVSLETPALQLGLLRSNDQADLFAGLDKMLLDLEQGTARTLMLRVARTWEAGRDTDLVNYADWCQCVGTARERAQLKEMLDDRNPGLADAIDRLHADGKAVFAAVGSLHLVGPEGVPALLGRRGYAVKRVPLPR